MERALPLEGVIRSREKLRHRGCEMALKAWLVNRVALLAKKAAITFSSSRRDILRIARRFNAGKHPPLHTSPEGTAEGWGVGLDLNLATTHIVIT